MMQNFDVESIRKQFPCLQQCIHGKPFIYLDSAATTQKPESVITAVEHFYRYDNANVHRGVHQLSQRSSLQFENVRQQVAQFLHAHSEKEIVFVRGTTEAINLVAQSYGRSQLQANDEIVISQMEHHANIVPWQMLCQTIGCKLRVIPIHPDGSLDLEAYRALLNEKTRIVAISHVSNTLGTINPIQEMTQWAKATGAIVLIDGAQAVAHLDVNVQELGCDFYAFSGHKMYGPSGIGILYGKEALLEKMPPWQGGGNMIRTVSFEKTTYNDIPHKFEAGTPAIEATIGLGAAIAFKNQKNMSAMQQYEKDLQLYATEVLKTIKGLRIIGTAPEKIAIFSFVLDKIHPHDVGTILDHSGIAVRTGHHCTMPLMTYYQLPATTRASFSFYNTKEEIEVLAREIEKVQKLFKVL